MVGTPRHFLVRMLIESRGTNSLKMKERIRDEDEELRKQLDLIMKAYTRMYETYSGSLEAS